MSLLQTSLISLDITWHLTYVVSSVPETRLAIAMPSLRWRGREEGHEVYGTLDTAMT